MKDKETEWREPRRPLEFLDGLSKVLEQFPLLPQPDTFAYHIPIILLHNPSRKNTRFL